MTDNLFVIDFEEKGNVIRLYYGKSDDYWGDDWNDRPYEHNAGTVYSKYVEEMKDYGFSLDTAVMSAENDWTYLGNSPFSKEDFQNRKAPCLIIAQNLDYSWLSPKYSDFLGDESNLAVKIYFGDSKEETEKKIFGAGGKSL